MLRRLALAAAALLPACLAAPEQVHVAWAASSLGQTDGFTASWAAQTADPSAVMQYGLSPSTLTTTVAAEQRIYLAPPVGMVHHHATVVGLAPATPYYYRVGSDSTGWSPVYHVVTPPKPGSEFPVSIMVFGDHGAEWNDMPTFADMRRLAPNASFVWHVGDVAYGDDADLLPLPDLGFQFESYWNQYMRNLSLSLTTSDLRMLPFLTMPGNHEAECHSAACIFNATLRESLGNFTAFNSRFRMPSASSNGTESMWYSFRYGSIHFVSIDTETDFAGAPLDEYISKNGGFGDQVAWLTADLAAAAEARARGEVSWILVGGHRPVYSRVVTDEAGRPSHDSANALQAFVEPLFQRYGVDLMVCGHEHSMEAIWPVFNSTNVVQSYDNPPYTTYAVVGSAGNVEGHTSYAFKPTPPWSRWTDDENFGIAYMTLHDKDTLEFVFRQATTGATLQSFVLTRQH